MIPIIIKYQVKPSEVAEELTKEDVQDILCSSVEEQPTSTVSDNYYDRGI